MADGLRMDKRRSSITTSKVRVASPPSSSCLSISVEHPKLRSIHRCTWGDHWSPPVCQIKSTQMHDCQFGISFHGNSLTNYHPRLDEYIFKSEFVSSFKLHFINWTCYTRPCQQQTQLFNIVHLEWKLCPGQYKLRALIPAPRFSGGHPTAVTIYIFGFDART